MLYVAQPFKATYVKWAALSDGTKKAQEISMIHLFS